MSTNSTNKNLLLPAQGDFPNTWGTQVTGNTFTPIDSCFGAQISITLTSSDHTVTTGETQAPIHNASGTLTGDVNVVYPATAGGFYIIENTTSGAHLVTAMLSGGSGVVVPQSARALIKADPSETAVNFGAAPDVLTTQGDLMSRDANTYSRVAVGTVGQIVSTDGTSVTWVPGLTTEGDLLTRSASAYIRLAIGATANSVLTSTGTDPAWSVITPQVVSALVDGSTPALNAALGNTFTLTSTTNPTIAVPTNPTAWQRIIIAFTASGGARTLALNTGAGGFEFGSDITALTQTVSGKTDLIGCVYNPTLSLWLVAAYLKGF